MFCAFSSFLKAEIRFDSKTKTLFVNSTSRCKWFFNGAELNGVNLCQLKVMTDGIYSVVYNDENGNEKIEQVAVSASTSKIHKIYVIGDSTASIYSTTYYPRTGWAQIFQQFFNTDSVLVTDKALSGRSSKSFYTDASGWPVVKPLLASGDFLIIQFAHNDEKTTDTSLYTEPYTTYKGYLTKYITEAKSKGAIPILATPINRNYWNTDTVSIKNSHGNYPAAMRELAVSLGVPLLDLTSKTESLYEQFGKYPTTWNIFLYLKAGVYSNYSSGNTDDTHLQRKGALNIAKLAADAIWESTSDTIQNFLVSSLLCDTSMNSIKYTISPKPCSGYILGPVNIPARVTSYLTAQAASGYQFVNWTEDGTVVSTNSILYLTGGTSRNLTANFSLTSSQINTNENTSAEIKIFPVPAKEILNIQTTDIPDEITIFDNLGVKKQTLTPTTKTNYVINIKNYSPGIYFVSIKSGGKSYLKKFIRSF
jgi:lysophospholipase L1-like esterase